MNSRVLATLIAVFGRTPTVAHETLMQVTRSDGNAPSAATLWERPPQQRANIPGAVRGYTSHADKLARISDGLDDINAARVLLHEAPHAVLPRPGQRTHHHRAGQPGPPRHRGDPANGAAYALADLLGLDTRHASVGYVAGCLHPRARRAVPTPLSHPALKKPPG